MTLRDNIDTNKNNHIDVSSQRNEITDFILDKNKGEENLNELGKHLNDLDPGKLDNLGIKDALQSYFNNPERTRLDQEIKNKVNKNELLTKKELNLLYLEMISKGNNQTSFQKQKFNPQQLKFDSTQPIEKICNGALISYIKNKYNNPLYVGKKTQIELTNQHKKTSKNPLDKIQENQLSDINLPENIGEIKESEADFYCNRLITRAENNFSNEISKAKREIEQKHRYKDEEEKKAYIKRDTLLIAFSKYTEAVNKKNEKLITNSGYKDKDNFQNQMKLMEEFGNEIQNKYPNINEILSKLKKFDEEMKNNEKKYFNDENETNKAEQDYKEFNEYMDKKSKEYGIDKIQESLKKEPKTKEEMEEYLQTMNKIFEFQEDLNKKNKTYGDSISKYQKYIKGIADIQKKYDIQQYQDILEKYNQDISNWNKKIDFKKYENYKNGLDWKLEVGIKNINTLEGIITDPQSEYFPIKQIKDIEHKKQIKQEGIDRFRKRIKEFDPRTYWMLTTFTGLWNGLIDATVGAGTSLGVMILGIIGGKDETLAQMDRKERRDNVLKINQSSSQKESVYNPETGFNFHADNTVSTVASSISQMLTLIYGGGAIGGGASKALGISENIAGKVGLFTSSFITQVGGNYQEAITHGLTGKNAIGYSFLSATIQSSLELISPNEVLLGKGNGIAKELIKNACNEGGKQSFMLIGKTFLKNVGLEIIEENIQEGLQTVAGNLINMVVNGTYGSDLGADWSWKNFASTAIITTLTTGITTGVSTGVQMYEMSNQDQTKLLEDIKSNNGLYLEVIGMLDKAIEGGVKIPNVSTEQLQNLKLSLTGNSDTNTPSANTNIPHSTDIIETDYEIKTGPEIEQISQILGSRFHEERRQSRLQSDGTYAPRVEKTSDQTWISQHNGQTEVDIANTPFEDLPSDWKSENLEAAKVAVGLVYDIVKKGEKVTSEMIEKMAEIVHNKRLERNGTEGSFENQKVPYEQLSEEEKAKDRNQILQAIETVTNGKSEGKIIIPSGKFEAPNEIVNFDDENGKFEYSNGILILKENGEEIGNAILKIEENCIYISGLVSFKKGSGTQLMRKIVEISDILGKGGHIEANASPYFSTNGQKSYRNQLTNLGFYYKLGFRAKDPEIHKKIQEYINKGEEIPLGLNYNRSIYLTDEGIQNLKNKDNSGDNDYFNGKSHKFEVTESQARSNSENMDKILSEINEENKSTKLEKLRKEIEEQYKQSTGEELELTDEQLISILDAHEQDGKLGELTLGQLRKKVKILSKTVTDPKVRRFLLEAGFCGQINGLEAYIKGFQRIKENTSLSEYDIRHLIIIGVNIGEEKIQDLIIFCTKNGINCVPYARFCSNDLVGNGILTPTEIEERTEFARKTIELKISTTDFSKFMYMNKEELNKIMPTYTNNKDKKSKEKHEENIIDNKENTIRQQISAKDKLSIILNKSIDDFKSIKSLSTEDKNIIINSAKNKFKGNNDRLKLCESPTIRHNGELDAALCFMAEYLYDIGLTRIETKYYMSHFLVDGKNLISLLDAIKDYGKIQIQSIPNDIFNREKIVDVLLKFGFIPAEEGYYITNKELSGKICEPRERNRAINENDVNIMYHMINIGEHKEFWKNLSPENFIKIFYRFKDMFIPLPGSGKSIIGTYGEGFFDKLITELESTNITEDEKKVIDDFVAEGYKRINRSLREDWSDSSYERQEAKTLHGFIQKHPVDETTKLNRTDRDPHRFDEVVLKNGITLTQILNNFEKYIDKIDEINLELANNPSHNKQFLSTSIGFDYNPMGMPFGNTYTGINWKIYLEKGSHAILRNMYSDTALGELEYIIQDGSNITYQIEIIEIEGEKYPQLIGYITTTSDNALAHQQKNTNYFNGKSHQFEVTETQARSNSENMDKLVNEINGQNKSERLEELRNEITEQYKQTTGEELELSDEQLLSILDAHEQDGILGELSIPQLRKKVKILDETITDPKVRRFLLEAGFCGSLINRLFNNQNQDHQPQGNNIERKRIQSSRMSPQEILRFSKNLDKRLTAKQLQPTNKINIGNGTIIYTTNKMVGKNSGRQYIIGYTFNNYGTMHLRQFYRSLSEGCWRACPGMREDGNLSKGEFITDSSYETTTKVDLSLGNVFDDLQQVLYKDFGPYNKYFSYSPISYIANEYHKDNILQEEMGPQNIYIRKLFPNLVGNDKTGHNTYSAIDYYNGKHGHTIESVIKGYDKLVPEGLDYKHMKINPSKSYSYRHDYLGHVNVQVCTVKRNGIDLDFHFARAINSPDKVWIENVVCSDAQLNSRGVYNKQINAGPLVAKPVDYDSQCPSGQNIDQILPKVSPDYRDIRNLYQGNPIIKKFKQISK